MASEIVVFDKSRSNHYKIDLDQKTDTELNLKIKDFSRGIGENDNSNFFTLEFDIHLTSSNILSLNYATHINIVSGSELIGKQVFCFLTVGFQVFRGYIIIQSNEVKNGQAFIKTQYLGGLKNFSEFLPERMRELDLGSHYDDFSSITQINQNDGPYDGTNPIYYIHGITVAGADFGTVVGAVPPNIMCIHASAIFEAISNYLGVTIESNFLNTEFFRRILHPIRNFSKLSVNAYSLTVNDQIVQANGPYSSLTLNGSKLDTDYSDLVLLSGFFSDVFVLNENIVKGENFKATFAFDLILSNTDGHVGVYAINSGVFVFETVESGNSRFNLEIENVNPDEEFVFIFYGNVTLEAGSNFRVFIEGADYFALGLNVNNNSIFLDSEKVSDFLSGHTDNFNLIIFYDEKREVLIIENKWPATLPTGETVPGFYRNIAFNQDWSRLVDFKNANFDYKVNTSLSRELVFKFSQDSNDGFDEGILQHTETLSDKYPKGTTEKQNKVFAATGNEIFEYRDISSLVLRSMVLPKIIYLNEAITTETSQDFLTRDSSIGNTINHRLLFKFGKLGYSITANGVTTNFDLAFQRFFVDAANRVNGKPIKVNLGYDDFRAEPGLVNMLYRKDISIYNEGFVGKFNINLPLSAILDIENLFRYRKFVKTSGVGDGYYILDVLKLIINKDKIASVEMIYLP